MKRTLFIHWMPLTVAVCAVISAHSAIAQDQSPSAAGPERSSSDWTFITGGGVLYAPDYEGSKRYKAVPIPLVEVNWRDRVRLSGLGGFVTPFKTDKLKIEFGVRYDFGRKESDNDALKGLGDLDVGAVAIGRLDYEIGPVALGMEVSRDVTGDREGLTATAEAEYGLELFGGRGRLSLTPHLTVADDSYMSHTFGVTAAQASRSARHYARYDAGAGLKDAGIAVGFSYSITQSIHGMSRIGYSRLVGDAADSPLVDREGNANQFSALLGVSYRW